MKLEFLPDGSDDCPLVRLYDFSPAEAGQLFAVLSALAAAERQTIAVHNLPGVEAVSESRLFLCSGSQDRGLVQLARPGTFECILTPATWDNVTGLTQPFLDGTPGYQWLVEWGDAKWLLSTDGLW